MKLYATNVGEMVLRFYAMMAVILIAGFTHQWWLGVVGFVIFFGTLVGAKVFDKEKSEEGGTITPLRPSERRKAM